MDAPPADTLTQVQTTRGVDAAGQRSDGGEGGEGGEGGGAGSSLWGSLWEEGYEAAEGIMAAPRPYVWNFIGNALASQVREGVGEVRAGEGDDEDGN